MRTRADLLPTKLKQYLPNYKVECIIRRGKDFFFPPSLQKHTRMDQFFVCLWVWQSLRLCSRQECNRGEQYSAACPQASSESRWIIHKPSTIEGITCWRDYPTLNPWKNHVTEFWNFSVWTTSKKKKIPPKLFMHARLPQVGQLKTHLFFLIKWTLYWLYKYYRAV